LGHIYQGYSNVSDDHQVINCIVSWSVLYWLYVLDGSSQYAHWDPDPIFFNHQQCQFL
jgi:hypothetical protein